jgi:hypothetical protein
MENHKDIYMQVKPSHNSRAEGNYPNGSSLSSHYELFVEVPGMPVEQ